MSNNYAPSFNRINFVVIVSYIAMPSFNPLYLSVAFDIETSHLISTAKKMTGVYMEHNNGLKWFKYFHSS